MRRQLVEIGVLTVAVAVATIWIGWWTVPLIGAGWGFGRYSEGWPVATSAVSASLAWVVLLAFMAFQGPVGALARQVGGVMGMPGWLFLAIGILFPAVLAGSAAAGATVVGELLHRQKGEDEGG